MGLIDDIAKFLSTRLEEYVRNNPQIELQVLQEQLRQQETEIIKIILDFEQKEKLLQEQILAIAEDIKTWHTRSSKAQAANRPDLANAATEREAALLKQGNQVWAQMQLTKQRLAQTEELHKQIKIRIGEVQAKIAQMPKSSPEPNFKASVNWDNLSTPPFKNLDDPLEAQFQQWEMDEEIETLKRRVKKRSNV